MNHPAAPRLATSLAVALLALPALAQTPPARPARPTAPAAPTAPVAAPPAPAASADAVHRYALRPTGQSRVLFTSDAPLETVDGISTGIAGNVTVDVTNPSNNLAGTFEVSATSLRTGVDLRDEHLRGESWLNAPQHPTVNLTLTGTTITGALAPNAPARGNVSARFTLRGVTRPITIRATVRRIPLGPEHAGLANVGIDADMLRIQGEFDISLSDYGIRVPALLQLKVSNSIHLRVDLTAYRSRG